MVSAARDCYESDESTSSVKAKQKTQRSCETTKQSGNSEDDDAVAHMSNNSNEMRPPKTQSGGDGSKTLPTASVDPQQPPLPGVGGTPNNTLNNARGSSSSLFSRRAAIPLKEKFLLNPWQKFLYYKRFPFKFIANVLIILCLLIYIYGYFSERSLIERNERFGLVSNFMPAQDNTADSLAQEFTSVDGAVAWVRAAAKAYYAIPDRSSGIWMHFAEVDTKNRSGGVTHRGKRYIVVPPKLELVVTRNTTVIDMERNVVAPVHTEVLSYALDSSNDFIGPFTEQNLAGLQPPATDCSPRGSPSYLPCRGGSNLTDFFDRVVHMTVRMAFRGVRRVARVPASIVRWDCTFRCGFTANRAVVRCQADFAATAANQVDTLAMIILTVLLVLYAGELVLWVRALWRYRRSNNELETIVQDLEEAERLQFRERLAGVSWRYYGVFCALLGLGFCIVAGVEMSAVTTDENVSFWRNLLLATTFFCQTLLLLSHLQTSPEYYTVIKTIVYAIPSLVYFTIGIMPLFVGFSILFLVCFGGVTNEFGTISRSFSALFSISNGDSVLQSFTQINQSENAAMRAFSRIIFTLYLLYFTGHAQNCVMGIVQNAYLRVTETFELNYYTERAEVESEVSDGDVGSSSSSSGSDSDGGVERARGGDGSGDGASSLGNAASGGGGGRNKVSRGASRGSFKDPSHVSRLARSIGKLRQKTRANLAAAMHAYDNEDDDLLVYDRATGQYDLAE